MFSLGNSEKMGWKAEVEVCGGLVDNGPCPDVNPEEESVWVFGYGSLCWFPGFEYKESVLGYVTGFKRRFWQGNATHRGTTVKALVWGRAFLVTGDAALPYLSQRECKLGGYATRHVLFHPHQPLSANPTAPRHAKSFSTSPAKSSNPSPSDSTPTKEEVFAQRLLASLRLQEAEKKSGSSCPDVRLRRGYATAYPFSTASPFTTATKFFNHPCDSGFASPDDSDSELRTPSRPFVVMMYVATEDNCHWLGKAPLQEIADQISECHGPSGSNADYLLNLARFMRTEFPSAKDDHLYVLERLVRERLAIRGQRALAGDAGDAAAAAGSQQFTARLPSKKLRCLNI